jgi:hypothetical protein
MQLVHEADAALLGEGIAFVGIAFSSAGPHVHDQQAAIMIAQVKGHGKFPHQSTARYASEETDDPVTSRA